MKPSRKNPVIIWLATCVILIMAVTGCRADPTNAPVVTDVAPTQEPDAATPTLTTEKLVLVDAQGKADEQLTTSLSEFAAANSLFFETRTNLEDSLEAVKVAVVFNANDGLTAIASANPQTQFVGVGSTKLATSGNLSTIFNKPEDLAFMAGQLATVVSEDWRSGGLLSANGISIEAISNAFENGGSYVCGTCYPAYPPYNSYPIYQDVSGKSVADMTADVEVLSTSVVDVTFVNQAADVPEVIAALKAAEIAMIGENPNSADTGNYAAILGFDASTALKVMLPKLLAGEGGQEAVSRVVLLVVNDEAIITPGRQVLFNKAAEALQGGWIIPLNVK